VHAGILDGFEPPALRPDAPSCAADPRDNDRQGNGLQLNHFLPAHPNRTVDQRGTSEELADAQRTQQPISRLAAGHAKAERGEAVGRRGRSTRTARPSIAPAMARTTAQSFPALLRSPPTSLAYQFRDTRRPRSTRACRVGAIDGRCGRVAIDKCPGPGAINHGCGNEREPLRRNRHRLSRGRSNQCTALEDSRNRPDKTAAIHGA